jgi:hypothetical protein
MECECERERDKNRFARGARETVGETSVCITRVDIVLDTIRSRRLTRSIRSSEARMSAHGRAEIVKK